MLLRVYPVYHIRVYAFTLKGTRYTRKIRMLHRDLPLASKNFTRLTHFDFFTSLSLRKIEDTDGVHPIGSSRVRRMLPLPLYADLHTFR